jgi:hypothetical protein
MPRAKGFEPNGDFSCRINQYLLGKALAALEDSLDPYQADFSKDTFYAENADLVEQIARAHPPPPSNATDTYKKVRENFHKQAKRFQHWLCTGDGEYFVRGWLFFDSRVLTMMSLGYPQGFAVRVGLIDSSLAGTFSPPEEQQVPGSDSAGDEDYQPPPQAEEAEDDDDDAGVPFADETPPPPPPRPKPKPAPKPTKKAPTFDDINRQFSKLKISGTGEMQIKTLFLKDVKLRGAGASFYDDDILVSQFRPPPGAVLKSLKVKPKIEDANKVDVSVDCDSSISNGEARCKSSWLETNPGLAGRIGRGLQESCDHDVAPGLGIEQDKDSFCWPDGKRSKIVPLDPFVLGFHYAPAYPGQSLFEIHKVQTDLRSGKKVVPCYVVTAFFLVEQPRLYRDFGDLEISSSEEVETPRNRRPRKSRKRRARVPVSEDDNDDDDDDDDAMDDGDDDDRKPAARSNRKPPPGGLGAAAASMFSLMGFAGVAYAAAQSTGII